MSLPPSPPRAAERRPLLFAHRGGMAHRAENTLTAFEHALAMGANALETDAWLTADGAVVLHHDGDLGRDGGGIRSLRRDELPRSVPSLSGLYARCGTSFDLAIDVIDPAAAAVIVTTADAAGGGAVGRLWLCHWDLDLLRAWRGLDARLHLVHSAPHWRHLRPRAAAHVALLAEIGVAVLNLRAPFCTRGLAELCHAHGVLLFGWDAQRLPVVRRLLRDGCDGVMGDHVDRLLRAAAEVSGDGLRGGAGDR